MIRPHVSLLLLLFITTASANEVSLCEMETGTYEKRLIRFVTYSCYDKIPEFSVERNRVRVDIADSGKDFKARLVVAQKVLRRISDELDALAKKRSGSEPANAHAREMAERIKAAGASLDAIADGTREEPEMQYWTPTRWEPGESGSDAEWRKLKKSLYDTGCFATEAERCETVFLTYMDNARYLVAMDIISDYVIELPVQRDIEKKELLQKQWTSYFEDQQFQFGWEMNANFCFFNPRNPEGLGLLKRSVCLIPFVGPSLGKRWAQEDADQGFVPPPTQSLTYLHPDIGFMYVDDQPSGNSFVPALVFQWLGYSWWDGYEQKTGKMKAAKGISFVSTVADLEGTNNVGYGLMARYRTFGLSITRHSSDWAVYLNLNLLKPFQNVEKRATRLKSCVSKKLSECK
jgi:hypothetical protein